MKSIVVAAIGHGQPGTLKAGAMVKASVEEEGGQKVVTAIQVN
jgi:hypothetical protein